MDWPYYRIIVQELGHSSMDNMIVIYGYEKARDKRRARSIDLPPEK